MLGLKLAKGASRVNVDVRRLPHLVIKGSPNVMTVAAQREANVGLAIVLWGWMGWSVGPLNSHDSHTVTDSCAAQQLRASRGKVNLIRYSNYKTTYSRVNALSPKCAYVQSVNRSMWIWTDTFMTVQCAGVTLPRPAVSAAGCVVTGLCLTARVLVHLVSVRQWTNEEQNSRTELHRTRMQVNEWIKNE